VTTNLLIVYNLFTKLTGLYAMPDKTALSAARAMFTHFVTYGMCEVVHSDLGSDFTSTTVEELLNGWCGVRQTFALQRNPQADGVEPVVKEVLKHMTAIMYDATCSEADWDKPEQLGLLQMILNETPHTQTGVSPLEATFGKLDAEYFNIPDYDGQCSHPYVDKLGGLLGTLRAASKAYRLKKQQQVDVRVTAEPVKQNLYQPGDYVLYKLEKLEKPTKIRPKNAGPYVVTRHLEGSNHVEVTDLVHDHHLVFDCKDLQICIATREEAVAAACKDDRQHGIDAVIAFRGEHSNRRNMTFLVRFGDGDECWLDWSPDITLTVAFETFCMASRFKMLQLLVLSAEQVKAIQKALKKEIVPVTIYGSTVYINLRSYGADWYDSLTELPAKDMVQYYVKCRVQRTKPHNPRKCVLLQDVFKSNSEHDMFYLNYFGDVQSLVAGEVELTDKLCKEYDLLR
jgi:hypothetical protein